jgi:hypothetical protein
LRIAAPAKKQKRLTSGREHVLPGKVADAPLFAAVGKLLGNGGGDSFEVRTRLGRRAHPGVTLPVASGNAELNLPDSFVALLPDLDYCIGVHDEAPCFRNRDILPRRPSDARYRCKNRGCLALVLIAAKLNFEGLIDGKPAEITSFARAESRNHQVLCEFSTRWRKKEKSCSDGACGPTATTCLGADRR